MPMEEMGQGVFYPLSVALLDGAGLLNAQTFLLRQNLALSLFSTADTASAAVPTPPRAAREMHE